MTRRPRASDEALVELFLDMLAAERGAGANTLSAYRNDLDDLSAHLRARRRTIANATTDDLRGFIASLSDARLQGVIAGASPVGGTPDLQISLRRGKTR